jgi:hypothetical protein
VLNPSQISSLHQINSQKNKTNAVHSRIIESEVSGEAPRKLLDELPCFQAQQEGSMSLTAPRAA